MRNWLLSLSILSLIACNKEADPEPDPPQQPGEQLNGWQKIDTKVGDQFPDIAFSTPANGFLAGEKGVYKTVDSGKTWTLDPSITARPVTINFFNSQYGYAVGLPYFTVTNNNGASWQNKTLPTTATDVCFVSPSTGYTIGVDIPLFKTTDTGSTWVAIGNKNKAPSLTVHFLTEQHGWYAVRDSVYQTLNGGTTWTGQKVTNNTPINTVFFSDLSNGWLTADTSVYRTTNGGSTWSRTNLGSRTFDIQFLNAQVGYVSVYNGIFKTTDGGTSWTRNLTAELNSFPELLFLDENTGWVTGSGGVIYRWKK